MIGVYTITNRINGDMYVGSSNNVDKRMYTHEITLRNNKHYNTKLQNAVNKYDLSNFEFKLLDECELDHQFATESYWYNMLNPSYNLVDVNPKGGRSWSVKERENQVVKSIKRIRVLCSPINATDPRECYLFESLSQAALTLFGEGGQNYFTKGIKDVLIGKRSQFKGWKFQQLDND
jgi:group I intron endonuclease